MINAAVLWCVWKLRNDLCFQKASWRDVRVMLMRIVNTAQNWLILCPEKEKSILSGTLDKIKMIAMRPGRITG